MPNIVKTTNIKAQFIYPILSQRWGIPVQRIQHSLQGAGIIHTDHTIDIRRDISAKQWWLASQSLQLPEVKVKELLVGEIGRLGDGNIIDPNGDIYPSLLPSTIIDPNTLLLYEPSVPHRVPTNLFGSWTFVTAEGTVKLGSGELLTAAQRAMIASTPESLIHRDEPEFAMSRSDVHVTFFESEEGEPVEDKGKKYNPIPSLARFMYFLEREAGAPIFQAYLIGSYGWGSASRNHEDVDLVVVFCGDYDRQGIYRAEKNYWDTRESKPLAIYAYNLQEWQEAKQVKKILTSGRHLDTFGAEGFNFTAQLGFSSSSKMLAWFHSYVPLIDSRRNVLEEYKKKMYILENQARKGDIRAMQELYWLNEEHPGLRRIVVDNIKGILSGNIELVYDDMYKIFLLGQKFGLLELKEELVDYINNPENQIEIGELALILIYSMGERNRLWYELKVKELYNNFYTKNLSTLSSQEIAARLDSFKRFEDMIDQLFKTYRNGWDTEKAIAREGATRIDDPDLLERCNRLLWIRYTPERFVSDK